MVTNEQKAEIKDLNARIGTEPENFDLQMALGDAYFRAGQYHLAQARFRMALCIDSKQPDAYDNYISSLSQWAKEEPGLKTGIEIIVAEIAKIGAENGVYSKGAERFV